MMDHSRAIDPSAGRWLRRLPFRIGPLNVFVTAVHFGCFAFRMATGTSPLDVPEISLFLYGLVTVNVFVASVISIAGRRRWARVSSALVAVVLCTALYGYRIHSGMEFEYAIVRDNIAEIMYLESFQVVILTAGVPVFFAMAAVLGISIFLEKRYHLLSRGAPEPPLLPGVLLASGLWALAIVAPPTAGDEVSFFFQSAYRYYATPVTSLAAVPTGFTVVRTAEPGGSPGRKPNVFVIMVESFNANFVEARSPEGVEYTPYFNSLTTRGMYVPRYYGNSIQTVKGQFALLFSVVPSIRGKVFVHFADRHFRSLPAVLRDLGYGTIFFQSSKDLDFDNTGGFLSANGFSTVDTIVNHLSEEDRGKGWGWGVQDDVFYSRFFEYLDARRAAAGGDLPPLFVTLATISSHVAIDMVPKSKRVLYPSPENTKQSFANTIHVADSYLRTFFDEMGKREYLADSIVIVTGDHSYPAGEHGKTSCVESFYDEFFRVPFLLIWRGVVEPVRVEDAWYSHMDVAPTLMDLLDLDVRRHHFEGVSMLDPASALHPIYLVQPYSGKYLSVVEKPYKYTKHLSGGEEYLFDLVADPGETANLAWKQEYLGTLVDMRKKLEFVFVNQELIQSDMIWPVARAGDGG